MPTLTVSIEIAADGDTYGTITDDIIDAFAGQLLAISIDFNTPSSASSPLVSVTFDDTDNNRALCAAAFFADSFADLTDPDGDYFAEITSS